MPPKKRARFAEQPVVVNNRRGSRHPTHDDDDVDNDDEVVRDNDGALVVEDEEDELSDLPPSSPSAADGAPASGSSRRSKQQPKPSRRQLNNNDTDRNRTYASDEGSASELFDGRDEDDLEDNMDDDDDDNVDDDDDFDDDLDVKDKDAMDEDDLLDDDLPEEEEAATSAAALSFPGMLPSLNSSGFDLSDPAFAGLVGLGDFGNVGGAGGDLGFASLLSSLSAGGSVQPSLDIDPLASFGLLPPPPPPLSASSSVADLGFDPSVLLAGWDPIAAMPSATAPVTSPHQMAPLMGGFGAAGIPPGMPIPSSFPHHHGEAAPGDAESADPMTGITSIPGPGGDDAAAGAAVEMSASASLRFIYAMDQKAVMDYVETRATIAQRDRFHAFRKIRFAASALRRIVTASTGVSQSSVAKSVPTVLSAVTRSYLSEVLMLARDALREERGRDDGALGAHHLREGYRRFHARGARAPISSRIGKKRLF
ncbi:hypothetical protein BC828DRAFT_400688 [Blastocladiella britannica]|nr:hypothetical protein BC828DRAFT_400688 [Blastocladiella britannica]